MNSMETRKSWERRPDETPKAYEAFQRYLRMPLAGEASEKRSLSNLARDLNLASTSGVEGWSAKYDWQERALAYDTHLSATAITVRETALKQFQQNVITRMGSQLAVLDEMLDRKMGSLLTKIANNPDEVALSEMKRLVDTMEKKDNLARRMANLPTVFTSEPGIQEDEQETVYIIGGSV